MNQKNQDLILKIALGLGGSALAYFGVIRPILKRTGIVKSAEESRKEREFEKADEEAAGAGTGSPWNPNFYKSRRGAVLLPASTAATYAKQIFDAYGWFNDDEDAVYRVFSAMKYKTQLSQLADVFAARYSADLYNYIRDFFNDDEMKIVLNKVAKYQ